jgi:23S rRNA pseudouridine1911/1915/1917 synthase
MYEHFAVTADRGQSLLRIDKFLTVRMEHVSRARIQAAAEGGNILVNGAAVKSNYKVKPLDRVQIMMPYPRREVEIVPEQIPLNIVYEDDELLVVNKPAGLVVHPGHGNYSGTLVNALAWHLRELAAFGGLGGGAAEVGTEDEGRGAEVWDGEGVASRSGDEGLGGGSAGVGAEVRDGEGVASRSEDEGFGGDMRAGLVHRIDKNTSGLLVVAKNEAAHAWLAKQFFDHTIERRYVALVWGNFDEDEGTITGNIARSRHDRLKMAVFSDDPRNPYYEPEGKHAVTHWRVLKRYGYVTLIECRLETGRTHQIRVHMEHIGHPLFNDERYGGDRILKGTTFSKYKQFIENNFSLMPRHALHARSLGFVHPVLRESGGAVVSGGAAAANASGGAGGSGASAGTSGASGGAGRAWMQFESPLPDDFVAVLERWDTYVASRDTFEAEE